MVCQIPNTTYRRVDDDTEFRLRQIRSSPVTLTPHPWNTSLLTIVDRFEPLDVVYEFSVEAVESFYREPPFQAEVYFSDETFMASGPARRDEHSFYRQAVKVLAETFPCYTISFEAFQKGDWFTNFCYR